MQLGAEGPVAPVISPEVVALAVGIGVGIGVLFGDIIPPAGPQSWTRWSRCATSELSTGGGVPGNGREDAARNGRFSPRFRPLRETLTSEHGKEAKAHDRTDTLPVA